MTITNADVPEFEAVDETDLEEFAPVAELIRATRVGGIPTLLASSPGPQLSAGLMFRVGWGDEALSTHGITHLVEHLALFDLGLMNAHHNGETAETYTHFHVTGSEAEVVDYLNGVCAALRDLPVHRMETEKELLRTEAMRRSSTGVALAVERFGARGPGLAAFDEFGLHALSEADVREWARTRFTRENAVLWVAGDRVPDGLDLALPSGERMPVPRWDQTPISKPAWFPGSDNTFLLQSIVARRPAVGVFTALATKALYRALRQEGGYSYTATCAWEPLDEGLTRVTVYADARPERRAAVVGGAIDVLAMLRAGTIDEAELISAKATITQHLDGPHQGAAMLPSAALRYLEGSRIMHPDEMRSGVDAVTTADVVDVAREVWADAIAQVPEGGLDWAGFTRTPLGAESVVEGAQYPEVATSDRGLIVGPDGVSYVSLEGQLTVRFDECVSLFAWPDGARLLYGADGFRIMVEPTMHVGLTPDVVGFIDDHVPADVRLQMPDRAADAIPRPQHGTSGDAAKDPTGIWQMLIILGFGLAGFLLVPLLESTGVPDAVLGAWVTGVAVGTLGGMFVPLLRARAKRSRQ